MYKLHRYLHLYNQACTDYTDIYSRGEGRKNKWKRIERIERRGGGEEGRRRREVKNA